MDILRRIPHVSDAMTVQVVESKTVLRALRDPMDLNLCAPVATMVSMQPWTGAPVSSHVLRRQHLTVMVIFALVSAARGHILVALAVQCVTRHVQIAQVLDPVIA